MQHAAKEKISKLFYLTDYIIQNVRQRENIKGNVGDKQIVTYV